MPGDPQECRHHAMRCMELATSIANPTLKASLLDLAQTWTRLAADLESTKRMLDAMDEPKDRGDGSDRPQ
jgi:hypothetical protein